MKNFLVLFLFLIKFLINDFILVFDSWFVFILDIIFWVRAIVFLNVIFFDIDNNDFINMG